MRKLEIFFRLPEFEQKLFGVLAENLLQFCPNCLSRVQEKSLSKTISFGKSNFFIRLRIFVEKNLGFGHKNVSGFLKNAFYESRGRHSEKIFFWIETFIVSFLAFDQKNIRPLGRWNFGRDFKNEFYVSRETFWVTSFIDKQQVTS